ncbi:hypothetical protein KKG61_09030 [bacterium]|nr:hypothetical protein [bacterium]
MLERERERESNRESLIANRELKGKKASLSHNLCDGGAFLCFRGGKKNEKVFGFCGVMPAS